MFALIQNGSISIYPYTVTDFRKANPNIGLPNFPTDTAMEMFNVFRVSPSTPPAYDERTQVLVEDAPVLNSTSAKWGQVWSVRDMTANERQTKINTKSGEIRAARNTKLAAFDWTQIADSTADKPAWATYRQALRDVPSQAGFPWTVTWPQEP